MKTKHTIEELIALAKLAKVIEPDSIGDARTKEYMSVEVTAASFIEHIGIRKGINKIENSVIYEAYCTWAEYPKSSVAFFSEFSKYFERKKTTDGMRCYLLNLKPTTLLQRSKEDYNEEDETVKEK